ncbi:MAG: endonuclease III [Oligoflexales bacterium]
MSKLRAKPRKLSVVAKRSLVEEAVAILKKKMPEPKCELYFETPFQLLVSVVLSAQTTDKSVNKCMKPIYKQGFSYDTVINWGQEKLLSHIRTIGLAPTKSKNVLALAKIIKERHSGEIPNNRQDLEDLPGVGRKTANVVLGELFGQPTIAVDTHVFRVGFRLGLHTEKTPIKAEQELLKIIPEHYLPAAHHWLILHGRYTCKAIKPLCEQCDLASLCPSLSSKH